jgi:uncharacterized protein (UPF0335 family)
LTEQPVAAAQLRSIVERIEQLSEQRDRIAADIREVYSEAKGNGFDSKALRKVIAARKRSAAERAELDALVEAYEAALGAAS